VVEYRLFYKEIIEEFRLCKYTISLTLPKLTWEVNNSYKHSGFSFSTMMEIVSYTNYSYMGFALFGFGFIIKEEIQEGRWNHLTLLKKD
jgi:hypothetical protein